MRQYAAGVPNANCRYQTGLSRCKVQFNKCLYALSLCRCLSVLGPHEPSQLHDFSCVAKSPAGAWAVQLDHVLLDERRHGLRSSFCVCVGRLCSYVLDTYLHALQIGMLFTQLSCVQSGGGKVAEAGAATSWGEGSGMQRTC